MTRELEVMEQIMKEKEREIAREEQQPLDNEGETLAEHKRFSFDIVDTPIDPLR